ncbi:type II toxin-antitoxin system VapC family toxin [Amycolatopsis pithecellobii]|uniref:PIN domain-containing protein n=1 Tax=Amycolatopsis pithecellobii TaxID=664692 RepID=A0A6N7Z2R9_9PSEU|nr:type II toxin-antitoxin system VapC family toxin [Amycolatopsis pithecellobii]MTD54174.1 PIN domain-containing protein [Amycolatopsis pithecellobii]
MILVADASFATKVLLEEEGTDIALSWWNEESAIWCAPSIVEVEVEAVLAVRQRRDPKVFGRHRHKLASTTWANMLDGFVLHTIDREVAHLASRLIRDHGPLRGADACYLAVAAQLLEEGPGTEVVLGSFDQQQRRAASAAGIPLTALSPPRSTEGPS